MNSADPIKKKRPTETVERQAGDAISGGERHNTQTAALAQASSASVPSPRCPLVASLPKEWSSRRLRFLARVNPATNVSRLKPDSAVSFLAMESIGEQGELDLTVTKQLSEIGAGYTSFQDGDVAVAKITPCFENGKGALMAGLENGVGFGTTELHVLRPKQELDGRFLLYCTQSTPVRRIGEREMLGAAGQKRVPDRFWRDLFIPLPSRKQQDDIVTYLDRETRRIDTIIEKNRRLLDLIDEKRTAFISHAVTRGYEDRAKLKPSGLTWLKSVPSSWQVLPLKYALRLVEYGISESLSGNGHIKVLTMAEIQNGEVLIPDRGCLTEIAAALVAQPGDLFFNRTNSRDLVGKVGLFRGAEREVITFASYLVRLRVNEKADPEYLNLLLNEYRFLNYVRGEAVLSINQANLSASRYSAQKIPLPPIDEQRAIVTRLKSQLASLKGIASKITRAIDLLRERRLALISAAVTGKLEVPSS